VYCKVIWWPKKFEAIIMYAGKTAIIKPFAALSGRVTRLGEFSPIWQLFTLGS
jgi:hypothetical protein